MVIEKREKLRAIKTKRKIIIIFGGQKIKQKIEIKTNTHIHIYIYTNTQYLIRNLTLSHSRSLLLGNIKSTVK